jgi:hypothetical protein
MVVSYCLNQSLLAAENSWKRRLQEVNCPCLNRTRDTLDKLNTILCQVSVRVGEVLGVVHLLLVDLLQQFRQRLRQPGEIGRAESGERLPNFSDLLGDQSPSFWNGRLQPRLIVGHSTSPHAKPSAALGSFTSVEGCPELRVLRADHPNTAIRQHGIT